MDLFPFFIDGNESVASNHCQYKKLPINCCRMKSGKHHHKKFLQQTAVNYRVKNAIANK